MGTLKGFSNGDWKEHVNYDLGRRIRVIIPPHP